MKTLLSAALLSLAIFASCNKSDNTDTTSKPETQTPSDTPSCIQNKIRDLQEEEVRNPPASVWRYTYNGNTVYYIPPYCCDQYGELYDANCNLICHPDGGITGKGDGQCTDFWTSATNGVEIWRDPR